MGSVAVIACAHPVCARATAEGASVSRQAEPFDAEHDEVSKGVHLHASVYPTLMTLGQHYDIQVRHPSGRFGAASFHAERSGVGLAAAAGLGIRRSRWFVVGAELQHTRVYAPLNHDFAQEIGVAFAPWVTTWFFGGFVELRGRWGLHGGASLGYARVQERLATSSERTLADGSYGLRLHGGKEWSLGNRARLVIGLRLGMIDANPFGLVAIAWREPLLPALARAADAGLGASVEFN